MSIEHSEKPAESFAHIFKKELKSVKERRLGFQDRQVNFKAGVTPEPSEDASLEELNEDALASDLCGLAISGGGIRSATFGLGVIQGLAKAALLPRIDYLSTVSGGGYVGSFLSRWIHEKGFEHAEAGLTGADPESNADVEQKQLRIQTRAKAEGPIDHLRRYSNYLAPNPGVFSLDGWLLFAIYIRNLFLNQLVFLLGATGVVVLARGLIEIYSITGCANSTGTGLGPFVFLFCLFLIAGGQLMMMRLFYKSCDRRGLRPASTLHPSTWWTLTRGLSILLAVYVSWFVNFGNDWHAPWGYIYRVPTAAVLLVISNMIGFACIAIYCHKSATEVATESQQSQVAGQKFGRAIRGGFAGLLSGIVVACVLAITTADVAFNVTFSVPAIMLSFVMAEMLYVGFSGNTLDEFDREWWSSVNSRLFSFAAAWIVFFGIVVFAPWITAHALVGEEGRWETRDWLYSVVFSGTTLSTVVGLFAATSSKTGKKRNRLVDLLAKMAPALFLVLLFVLLSFLVTFLNFEIYEKVVGAKGAGLFDVIRNDFYLDSLNQPLVGAGRAPIAICTFGAIITILSFCLGQCVGGNAFSLHNMYSNRLARCYLGATNFNRTGNALTDLDPQDDLDLHKLAGCEATAGTCRVGPTHIINAALNRSQRTTSLATNSKQLDKSLEIRDRQAESFVFTPEYCGSTSTGYFETDKFAGGIKLAQAMAVSGAAVSPNMGYHSSPAITALLTLFNLRLGAWFGNPKIPGYREQRNPSAGWSLLWDELLGRTNENSKYVYVSDGGHFENMGVYELIRRRNRFIFAVDADAAPDFHENIGRVVRMARIDFGVRIEIESSQITPDENGLCDAHVVVGRIHYGDVHNPKVEQPANDPDFNYGNNQGIIVWIALAVTGDEPADIQNYKSMNPDFPYRTTGDQFFDENQFESYRELGEHSVETVLRDCMLPETANPDESSLAYTCKQENSKLTYAYVNESEKTGDEYRAAKAEGVRLLNGTSTRILFQNIYNHWLEMPSSAAKSISHKRHYIEILEKLRDDAHLSRLADEILGAQNSKKKTKSKSKKKTKGKAEHSFAVENAERMMIREMTTLLENVYVSLDFRNSFRHPVHKGWRQIFHKWTRSSVFAGYWFDDAKGNPTGVCHEFSLEFQRFIKFVSQPQ